MALVNARGHKIEGHLNPLASTSQMKDGSLKWLASPPDGGRNEKRIRAMVERGGWVEADAVVVRLGIHFVALGIGLAVRDRRKWTRPTRKPFYYSTILLY